MKSGKKEHFVKNQRKSDPDVLARQYFDSKQSHKLSGNVPVVAQNNSLLENICNNKNVSLVHTTGNNKNITNINQSNNTVLVAKHNKNDVLSPKLHIVNSTNQAPLSKSSISSTTIGADGIDDIITKYLQHNK